MSTMTAEQLDGLAAGVLGESLDDLIEQVRVAGMEYGRQKARVEYLDEMRKVVLAAAVEDYRAAFEEEGIKITETRLESKARSSTPYKEHVRETYTEKLSLVELESTYYSLRNRLDALTEKLRLARSEMYMNGRS